MGSAAKGLSVIVDEHQVLRLTLRMEPIRRLGTERQKTGGRVFLLEVKTTEDL